jgi:hypothetical protein
MRNSPLVGQRPPLKQSLKSGAGLDMSAGDSRGEGAGVEGARSPEGVDLIVDLSHVAPARAIHTDQSRGFWLAKMP